MTTCIIHVLLVPNYVELGSSLAALKIKMSEYEIPFHIQEDIMKRLPVKSLVQFRSVSKAWKCLIDSSEFIAAHSNHCHTQPQHLLVSYEDPIMKEHYVCFVDDDTFPQQRSVLTLTLPLSVKYLRLLGSSHGLLCLYHSHHNPATKMVVLWNPLIRKSIVVDVPKQPYVCFGVCPLTCDPKIISIYQIWDEANIETSFRCKVMVYTLSSGKWRTLSSNLPTKPIRHFWLMVVTDRFIYWLVELPNHNMIMSFDVSDEKFETIDLLDSLATHHPTDLHLSKLRDSLAMLQNIENILTVWMMEHGVQRSFTKLFIIKTPNQTVGFRNSGAPIMKVTDDDPDDFDARYKLAVFEPNLGYNNVIEVSGSPISFEVRAYMETLLLLVIDVTQDEDNGHTGVWSFGEVMKIGGAHMEEFASSEYLDIICA
uniref:F-box domain-containing protein n=1 Tax=Lactuca sativa TaxID=4236 RepID=A0A9R1X0N8_LACSA|nr:hypothetical protein LSAT_V11C700343930 [Lactuca sativa]